MIDLQLERKIKDLAKNKNISIRQLCLKIEMSEQGFGSSLKNNTLKIETLQKIADVFDIQISEFFLDENIEKLTKKIAFYEDKLNRLSIFDEAKDSAKDKTIEAAERLIEMYEKQEQLYLENRNFFENNTDMLIAAVGSVLQDVYHIGKKNNLDLKEQIENTFGYKALDTFIKLFGKELQEASEKRNEMLIKMKKDGTLFKKDKK